MCFFTEFRYQCGFRCNSWLRCKDARNDGGPQQRGDHLDCKDSLCDEITPGGIIYAPYTTGCGFLHCPHLGCMIWRCGQEHWNHWYRQRLEEHKQQYSALECLLETENEQNQKETLQKQLYDVWIKIDEAQRGEQHIRNEHRATAIFSAMFNPAFEKAKAHTDNYMECRAIAFWTAVDALGLETKTPRGDRSGDMHGWPQHKSELLYAQGERRHQVLEFSLRPDDPTLSTPPPPITPSAPMLLPALHLPPNSTFPPVPMTPTDPMREIYNPVAQEGQVYSQPGQQGYSYSPYGQAFGHEWYSDNWMPEDQEGIGSGSGTNMGAYDSCPGFGWRS